MIVGYKGFDRNLQCRGFQYEVGQTYTMEQAPGVCESGFHFCESPLDVLRYYPAMTSRYCLVEGNGQVDHEKEGTKLAVSEITIVKELSLYEMIQAAPKKKDGQDLSGIERFVINDKHGHVAQTNRSFGIATSRASYASACAYGASSVAITEREASVAVATGGLALALGYRNIAIAQDGHAIAMATDTYSGVDVHGSSSMGIAYGVRNWARGELGCWLVLTEWKYDEIEGVYDEIEGVQVVQVDGKTIQPNTWYRLMDGQIVEYEYANHF